jgi:hypothetical protein
MSTNSLDPQDWHGPGGYFLYVICHRYQDIDGAPVKVGITRSPGGRLASLQTASPHKLAISAAFKMPTFEAAKSAESIAHILLGERRMHGEWFHLAPRKAASTLAWMIYRLADYMGFKDDEFDRVVGATWATEVLWENQP